MSKHLVSTVVLSLALAVGPIAGSAALAQARPAPAAVSPQVALIQNRIMLRVGRLGPNASPDRILREVTIATRGTGASPAQIAQALAGSQKAGVIPPLVASAVAASLGPAAQAAYAAAATPPPQDGQQQQQQQQQAQGGAPPAAQTNATNSTGNNNSVTLLTSVTSNVANNTQTVPQTTPAPATQDPCVGAIGPYCN